MHTHVRTLAILHIVFGALGLLFGLGILVLFGGIGGLVSMTADRADAALAAPILGVIGTVIFIISAVLSLPGIVAGIGLLDYRHWARILTIILSIIHVLNFPFGTALGVYGLWVLLAPETTARFQNASSIARVH